MTVAVSVGELRVDLSGSGADVVDAVSFTIRAGEIVGLVGESGSGKTTVGTALLGHARRGATVAGGRIAIDGQELLGLGEAALAGVRGSVVAYVPQDPSTALNPALRLGIQLRELLDVHAPEAPRAQAGERIAAALRDVRLPDDPAFLRRYPHQLSGGQQQRVCLAMAFLLRPRAIVLDEPTTGLDVTTQAHVLATVRELCAAYDVAALYVTHDLAVVANLADRVLVMYAGRIVEAGARDAVLREPAHPYTTLLLAASPDLRERRRMTPIPGHAPAPGARPGGCSFAPRCPLAIERCRAEAPALTGHARAPGREVACHRAGELEPPRRGEVADAAGSTAEAAPAAPATATAARPLLSVRDVHCSYGAVTVLRGVSLAVEPRSCVAIVGESGSGKTTLVRTIAGLRVADAGEIALDGRVLDGVARRRTAADRQALQYVFQNPYASLNPRKSVAEILTKPVRHFFGGSAKAARPRVAEALEAVGLPERVLTRYPDQLSGGERQRVAIARALACDPRLLICDEITSALDVSVQATIVDLLGRLRRERGLGLIFVTHDLALVRTIADRVVVLDGGAIVEAGATDDVLDRPQADYTRELLADTPSW
ncbi:ABC transporter ATP-binding protein [Conexibacter woesei]|uniref:Oligopeptide/dipeptide ABC transporter, ATPase subunit n=1 Tax=Conexibacter woesei (strain DSM 14684 / CCUG 47730 / CIP 108061 / JCM 11494 / NBRC 100937 / ID131577) TaxID=469383 RepID=D3F8E4_CONWI|nr:ABC transporter ATP-binding protein [Conexibacter woesei]ADB49014.1 oligopeptide/dipeptide ABC transporter, ATPase subunit [Conexibacter woesei DSM 14684]